RGLAARGAQFVEQRQQHDRDVLVATLQSFKVIRQQHDAAHHGRACVVPVCRLAAGQRQRQQFHFLGDHRRRMQLDHPQRAVHLVQQVGTGAHAGGITRVHGSFREGLDLMPGLAQRFIQLGLDPAQRGGVDCLPQRAHCRALLVMPCRRPPQAGSLKSATERRRSAASWARLPIDSAVWLAPCEVCVVICWIVFIAWVMLAAAPDCCCAADEMPWMRFDRSDDTFSISPRAVTASSAQRAPATTSAVVCSIEVTASLVSAWIVWTSDSIRLVAFDERSASRCTSSATTANPRPASPAEAAWMAALSARMFVCSEMSLISSTIEPISCEDSPRRLIRFEVSWIWSRMLSMPWIVWRTTPAPLVAISTERCATSADSAELRDTWSMLAAISVIRS